jgi:hypothetical protein
MPEREAWQYLKSCRELEDPTAKGKTYRVKRKRK